MAYSLNSEAVAKATHEWLEKRGVKREDIAELVYFLQKDYYPDLSLEECLASVDKVLTKREVHNAVLTGIQLDLLAEEGKLLPPLQEMVYHDEGLYGIDEVMALSIVNVYGSIGFTNYGFIDIITRFMCIRKMCISINIRNHLTYQGFKHQRNIKTTI